MTGSKAEIDDLKNLQREAAELREKRKRARSKVDPEKDEQPGPEDEPGEARSSAPDPDEDEPTSEDDDEATMAATVGHVVHEFEIFSRKHPTLVLVSALTVGFFTGKLFSRR